MRLNNKQSGFALVEILVTAVILAIGISGLGLLLLKGIQGTQDSAQQSQAMWIVHDYAGRIRSNAPGARLDGYVIGNTAESYDCETNEPVQKCADYWEPALIGSGKLVSADICSSVQMAAYDRWTTLCGVSSEAHTYSSPSDFLVNPILTAECSNEHASRSTDPVTGQPDCVQYTISLTWDTKGKKGNEKKDLQVRENSYSVTVELN